MGNSDFMNKSYRKQLNDIRTEIGNIGTSFAKGLAEQAHEDLRMAHKQIIDNFYAAHDPNSYNRREGLYNSIIPQGVNATSKTNTYQASIVVGSFKMDDHYRGNITPDNVFDLMWNKGVRGLPKIGKSPASNGEKWHNPTWISRYGERENVFRTSVTIGGYTSIEGTPSQVMDDIANHWSEANGEAACEKVLKKIKDKYR